MADWVSAVPSKPLEDFVFYLQVDSPIKGAEGFVKSEKKNFDAFKGFTMPIYDLLAEGDKVAAYLIFEGNIIMLPF